MDKRNVRMVVFDCCYICKHGHLGIDTNRTWVELTCWLNVKDKDKDLDKIEKTQKLFVCDFYELRDSKLEIEGE